MTALRALENVDPPADRRRAAYTDAFKIGAVTRVRGGQAIVRVARDLGISRNTLKAWMETIPVPSGPGVATAAATGSRRAVLVALRDRIAAAMDDGMSSRDMPANARLLGEVMREIEAIDLADDEESTPTVQDQPFDPEEI